jgi:hypothetical protein
MRMHEVGTAWTGNADHNAGNPLRGKVKVSRRHHGWAEEHQSTGGACYAQISQAKHPMEGALWALVEFHTMVVNYGIEPQVAHEAMLAVDEYRWIIAPDAKGAEDQPQEIADQFKAGIDALRKAAK